MTIIERVQTLLEQRDLNARDLCKGTGIKDSTYSAWKTRGTNPSAEYIAPIAGFLGVSVYYLLTGEEPPAEKVANDQSAERLLAYWSRFNELGKAQMLSTANAYSHVPEYVDEK